MATSCVDRIPTDDLLTSQVCADCGTILGDRIVDTRSECEYSYMLIA
jgi:transcription initiation factor TFIIIB Brf1 subunit/transcription initiation factor TFIIB